MGTSSAQGSLNTIGGGYRMGAPGFLLLSGSSQGGWGWPVAAWSRTFVFYEY